MGDISDNLSRSEFACQCGCGFDTVDTDLVRIVQYIRDFFGAPVTINSGCRCVSHNAAVGGGDKSQHLYGRAADIVVDGVHPDAVYDIADEMGIGGVGKYDTFTHVDSRTNGPARWGDD